MIETGTARSGIKSGAQLAEEQKHDHRHQHERDGKRADNLGNGGRDKNRVVKKYNVCEVVGKPLLQQVHGLAHLAGHLDRVGARRLVDADRRCWRAIVSAIALLGLGTEIDARHVLDPHDRSVGVGAQDDVVELVGPRQASFGRDGELKLLALR